MTIGTTELRTFFHSRTLTTVGCIVLTLVLHLIWFSVKESLFLRTLHFTVSTQKYLPLLQNQLDSYLHYKKLSRVLVYFLANRTAI